MKGDAFLFVLESTGCYRLEDLHETKYRLPVQLSFLTSALFGQTLALELNSDEVQIGADIVERNAEEAAAGAPVGRQVRAGGIVDRAADYP